jgi:hypothetical protein
MRKQFLSAAIMAALLVSAQGAPCPKGSAYDDGCLDAPAGTPQYPNLLDRYGANRPPWNVAGVDYHVGMPEGQLLKDWQTLKTDPNWAWLPQYSLLRYVGSGKVVLDGYDFTTGTTGWSIYTNSCTGLTITNCKIGCIPGAGTGVNAPGWGGANIQSENIDVVFNHNTVDYGDCLGMGGAGNGLITMGVMGCTSCSMDFEYNYLNNMYNTVLCVGGNMRFVTYKYNLIRNPATSAPGDPEKIHMNSFSGASGIGSGSNVVVSFNTTFAEISYAGGEFIQMYFNGGGTRTAPVLSNNTFPLSASGRVSYNIHGTGAYTPTTTLVGGGTNSQNYFDITGNGGTSPYYPQSMNGWTSCGNMNMVTGQPLESPYGAACAGTTAETPVPAKNGEPEIYPNPSNPSVVLRYDEGAVQQIRIYDLNGRMVEDLTGTMKNNGAVWNAAGKPAGVYLARFVAGDGRACQKRITLTK